MSYIRWAPSILGFPIAGWVAFQLIGSVRDATTALAAGAIAGAILGAVQWAALGRRVTWRWLVATMVGMGVGSAAATFVTGAATDVGALAASGLITGAAIGLVQGVARRWTWRVIAAWTTTMSVSWAAGWAITANVIVDAESGYVTFGLSGALLVTVVTGVVLRRIMGSRRAVTPAAATLPASESVAASFR